MRNGRRKKKKKQKNNRDKNSKMQMERYDIKRVKSETKWRRIAMTKGEKEGIIEERRKWKV